MVKEIINTIRTDTRNIFDEVDTWFNENENVLNYHPSNGGWNIREVLEHIALTNHFLLILIKKGTIKSIEKAKSESVTNALLNYDLDWEKLHQVGLHQSFEWNRPGHMEPTGNEDLDQVKNKLHQQVEECLYYLEQLKNGDGVLYKITMSVNDLGKIDVYHYIYFLAQHAKRHLAQMQKIKIEFERIN